MTLRSRMIVLLGAIFALLLGGCGSQSEPPADKSPSTTSSAAAQSSAAPAHDAQFCAHNMDPKCPAGSYVGPFVAVKSGGGHWDANGAPVNGGPVGADGSTGNNLTQEYCARNEDPACPVGSFVGPNAIRNPDGTHTYVVCEGTICTNPNHGAGDPVGTWGPDGQPINGGPVGADGSTGNNLTHEYCARNEDPACPAGTFVAPNAIKNPDGSNGYSPCEGTICTNPNHGAGEQPDAVDPPPGDVPDIETDAPPADDADDGTGDDAP